jgi:hypothetical protein
MRWAILLVSLSACLGHAPGLASSTASDDRRLVLVTMDGTRWQEVFRGADDALAAARSPFRAATADERRRALMPFFWGTIVPHGQVFGDADNGGRVLVANPYRISYPGYHDLLSGFVSPDLRSNDKVPNADLTVLEWLNQRPRFHGGVAVFASWDDFPFIYAVGRSALPVDVGLGRDRSTLLDRLRQDVPPPWTASVYDAFTVEAALRHLDGHDVRVLHLALGDTDEWAHAGRYDRYLESIHQADGWMRELWDRLQGSPAFRGRTSLIVTTDHGRGNTPLTWPKHSAIVPGAEEAWIAVMGPFTPARGERRDPASLAQVAATAAQLLGEDFRQAVPAAAPPLPLAP